MHVRTFPTVVDCGSPPSISNGNFNTPINTTYEELVTYSCITGYEISGMAMVSCLASGSWNTTPSCERNLYPQTNNMLYVWIV